MITCQQNFSLQTSKPCIDFTQIVWGVPTVSPPTNGSLVFSFSKDTITLFEVNDNAPLDGFSISNNGDIGYTGPACNCKATISGSITGSWPHGESVGFVVFLVNPPGTLLVSFVFVSGANNVTIPFTIPASVGQIIRCGGGLGFFGNLMQSFNQNGANTTNLKIVLSTA